MTRHSDALEGLLTEAAECDPQAAASLIAWANNHPDAALELASILANPSPRDGWTRLCAFIEAHKEMDDSVLAALVAPLDPRWGREVRVPKGVLMSEFWARAKKRQGLPRYFRLVYRLQIQPTEAEYAWLEKHVSQMSHLELLDICLANTELQYHEGQGYGGGPNEDWDPDYAVMAMQSITRWLPRLTGLKTLCLHVEEEVDDGLVKALLLALTTHPRLEHLQISTTENLLPSAPTLELLARFPSLKKLSLHLDRRDTSEVSSDDIGAHLIHAFGPDSRLTHLDLTTFSGTRTLTALCELGAPRLEALSLRSNQLDAASMDKLLTCERFPCLTSLDLSSNPITCNALADRLSARKVRTLETLQVKHTQITRPGSPPSLSDDLTGAHIDHPKHGAGTVIEDHKLIVVVQFLGIIGPTQVARRSVALDHRPRRPGSNTRERIDGVEVLY